MGEKFCKNLFKTLTCLTVCPMFIYNKPKLVGALDLLRKNSFEVKVGMECYIVKIVDNSYEII